MIQTIKLFAFLKEQISSEVAIPLPDKIDKENLLAIVAQHFPLYRQDILACNVAINQTFITEEIFSNDRPLEIALIPPVSGG